MSGIETASPVSSPSSSSAVASAQFSSLTSGVDPGRPSQVISLISVIRAEG